ncbi:hypothetical protein GP486_007596 [Trichoglossum hirsutum]|uniref:Amino acid permease/ SLC12A domain-containing protein n=1 Tax=Trichoglossum hirsutum TaxID=265104 RepID=A0A9P8I628_9PEZI|nr:hypothetical protein GP486_007596 [Trichoglossum hirsutum]
MAEKEAENGLENRAENSLETKLPVYEEPEEAGHRSLATRFLDSFKREPNYNAAHRGSVGGELGGFDMESATANTASSPLARKLKNRHLQMIAIGGSIGTGLFVGSGSALANGGPASLLIAFILIGVMLYCTVHALGEMAVLYPVAGSFAAFSTRFLDPAWGFAMGWNYAMQWLVVLPLEITAATITIEFWTTTINKAVFVTIFWIVIVLINLFGVRGYGEAEFVFSMVKIVAVIGFM